MHITIYKVHQIWLFLLFFSTVSGYSQTLNDGIFMPKKTVCGGFTYTHEAWNKYWEGSLNRTNDNIGTIRTQSVGSMLNYGISDRLNIIGMLPFVKTQASAGTLSGQRGLQDLTLALKYKLLNKRILKGESSLQLIGGGSVPLSNYVADYLPLSIGMYSKTAFGRILLHYLADSHFTFALSSTYMSRGKVKIDRNSYYSSTTNYIESNEIAMPDVIQFMGRTGYYSYRFQAEALYENSKCLRGSDIRRQDMPLLNNKMESSKIGLSIAYRIKYLRDIQLVAMGNYTLSGRNVGQSTAYTLGLMRAFGKSSPEK